MNISDKHVSVETLATWWLI